MCPATRAHIMMEEETNDANRARPVGLHVHARSVAVPGGSRAVELVTFATEPALASYGISSQRKLGNWLRAAGPT